VPARRHWSTIRTVWKKRFAIKHELTPAVLPFVGFPALFIPAHYHTSPELDRSLATYLVSSTVRL
jgi:hypothetical protein